MTVSNWLELVQLAELLCPVILMDLPLMLEADAYGTLLWLRHRKELQP